MQDEGIKRKSKKKSLPRPQSCVEPFETGVYTPSKITTFPSEFGNIGGQSGQDADIRDFMTFQEEQKAAWSLEF